MMNNEEIQNDVYGSQTDPRPAADPTTGGEAVVNPQPVTTQEQPKRRKWSKEENTELWKCYVLSNPQQRGYRKRMTSLWHERANHQITEQRLADQIRTIQKKNWLTETEREEIKRRIEEPDITQENEEPVEIPRVYEVNNLQPENEEQNTVAEKIRRYATHVPNRLPSLKECNSRLLKEKN